MKLFVEMPEHHYNNITSLDAVNLGRIPYKGIVMYAINAIKHGVKIEPILDRLKSEIKVYSDPQGFICISEKRLDDIFEKCMAESEDKEWH